MNVNICKGVEVDEVVLCVLAGGFSAKFIFSKYSRILSCKFAKLRSKEQENATHTKNVTNQFRDYRVCFRVYASRFQVNCCCI